MTDLEKVLIKRDKMSKNEAHEVLMNVRNDVLNSGYDYEEVEDMLLDDFGLEPDYIMDIVGW